MGVDRESARAIARRHLDREDPMGWFEVLYQEARQGKATIPWADRTPNPHLVEWLDRQGVPGRGRRALKVGCGLGDDAEALAQRGFSVLAFDISPTAIQWCRERFPESQVEYAVADLFHPPPQWIAAFDLVVESYTLQVLPETVRAEAMDAIARFVSPGGTLLVICRGRDPADTPGKLPWPLVRDELAGFLRGGLALVAFEDFVDAEDPPVRRFRAEYRAT